MPREKPLDLEMTDPKSVVDIFKIVNDHYRNDINAVWQRSQYFMLADLGLLSFFYSSAFDRHDWRSVMLVSVMGFLFSILWVCITIGTIVWINVWRKAVVEIEEKLVPFGPFKRGEAIGGTRFHELFRPEHYSVLLASLFAILWLVTLGGGIHFAQ